MITVVSHLYIEELNWNKSTKYFAMEQIRNFYNSSNNLFKFRVNILLVSLL